MIKNIQKFIVIYYGVLFCVIDYLLYFVFKANNYNFIHIFTFDIALGIIFYLILNITKGKVRCFFYCFLNTIVLLYSFLIIVEIFLKINYDATYPIKTISANIYNVIAQYNDEVLEIVVNNIFSIIIYIIIIISFFIFSKKLYLYDNKEKIKKNNLILLIIATILLCMISIVSMNRNVKNWNDYLVINGLKTAVINNLFFDDTNKYEFVNIINEDNVQKDEYIEDEVDNVIYDYNILDFDFKKLNKNETREEFIKTNNYIEGLKATRKNSYTGLFKNKNLIMICAEAWNSIIVNEELFPTMYRLINNGFKFNEFYQPHSSSSTSSGEYAFLTGMISVEDDYSFRDSTENNMGFTISSKLHDEGYNTISFHNGTSTYYSRDETHQELLGFDKFYANDTGLASRSNKNWPNDIEMFDCSFDILPTKERFMAYYMTYSGHMPYEGEPNRYYLKYKEKIDTVVSATHSIVYKNYIAKNMILEEGLTHLLDYLEKNNILNDTVICMVPDHYPYGLYRSNQFTQSEDNYVKELYGIENIDDDLIIRDKTDCILWCGSLENIDKEKVKSIDKPTTTIDLTPTLLNLFGIDFDSRIYPGHDIFSNEEGIVIYQDGRFVIKDYVHHNSYEKEPTEYSIYKNKVANAINYCKFNIKNDYYGYLVGESGEKIKTCYLMIEGGPTDNTLKMLEILDKEKVSATFFISENKKMEYLPLINQKGHKIGISLDNIDLIKNEEYELFADKINKLFSTVLDVTRDRLIYVHLTEDVKKLINEEKNVFLLQDIDTQLRKLSLKIVDANVDSKDLSMPITKYDIVENVEKDIENKDHIFVLLHDYDNTYITVEALTDVIQNIKQKGYKFKYMESITKIYKE